MRYQFALAILGLLSLRGFAASESTTVNYRTKSALDATAFRANSGSLGWSLGLQGAQYYGKSNAYYGGAFRAGSTRGGSYLSDNFFFAGLSFGFDTVIKKYLALDLNLAFGYSEAKLTTEIDVIRATGFAVNPAISVGAAIGEGWRIYSTGGYFLHTGSSEFSGMTVGLRVERKIAVQIKGVDD